MLFLIMMIGALGGGERAAEESPVAAAAASVHGMNYAEAEASVVEAGFSLSYEELNNNVLVGMVDKRNWQVCEAAPVSERSVKALVGKGGDCGDDRERNAWLQDMGRTFASRKMAN